MGNQSGILPFERRQRATPPVQGIPPKIADRPSGRGKRPSAFFAHSVCIDFRLPDRCPAEQPASDGGAARPSSTRKRTAGKCPRLAAHRHSRRMRSSVSEALPRLSKMAEPIRAHRMLVPVRLPHQPASGSARGNHRVCRRSLAHSPFCESQTCRRLWRRLPKNAGASTFSDPGRPHESECSSRNKP